MKFALIPPGEFVMGSPDSEVGRSADETQHRVKLTRGFYIGVTPVTQGQWQAVMGGNPSHFRGWFERFFPTVRKGLKVDLDPASQLRPVESVLWGDSVSFCERLTERERLLGRIGAQQRYRLPTEAEWEYACRAGAGGLFGGTGRLEEMAWYGDRSGGNTHPVGRNRPNAWGLYDMHGNVWEWCADWYGLYPAGEVTDPTGPANGEFHVLRGGSWRSDPAGCRSAARTGALPNDRFDYFGFRVVLDLE